MKEKRKNERLKGKISGQDDPRYTADRNFVPWRFRRSKSTDPRVSLSVSDGSKERVIQTSSTPYLQDTFKTCSCEVIGLQLHFNYSNAWILQKTILNLPSTLLLFSFWDKQEQKNPNVHCKLKAFPPCSCRYFGKWSRHCYRNYGFLPPFFRITEVRKWDGANLTSACEPEAKWQKQEIS